MLLCSGDCVLSHLLSLRKNIGDLGWKHQHASIVPLDECYHHFGSLLRLVLLEEMACGGKDLELKFALNC